MGNNHRWPVDQAERILPQIDVQAPGCWVWTGGTRNGYGRTTWNSRRDYVHRVMWEMLVGPIPDGLQIDHLCRVKLCCNPDHLEPVTPRVNVKRSSAGAILRRRNASVTHCPRGHCYSPENTLVISGHRRCRTCNREQCRARRQQVPAERAVA
jgi:hypothetical protein